MPPHNFSPACKDEETVFGAARPGITREDVDEWIQYMKEKGIRRVCCLLEEHKRDIEGEDLLVIYRQEFGEERVLAAPIQDFHLCGPTLLREEIIPFLREVDERGEKVVVHCAGGIGRTGHVLSAWLAAGRGLAPEEAIAQVIATGRDPYEATYYNDNITREDVVRLIGDC